MSKKKILFITWSFSLGGGAEKILENISNGLSDEYDIDVLEINHHGIGEGNNRKVNVLKPIFKNLENASIFNKIKWKFFLFFPKLFRYPVTRKKYDYEIAFNYLYPVYLLNNDAKTISWNHGTIYNLKNHKFSRIRQGKKLKYVNKIISISEKTSESIKEIYPEYDKKIELVYNGYDFQNIHTKSLEDVNIKFEEDSLIYLGRIEESKGIKRLLEVVKNVVEKIPDKKLYLLGKGNLEEYVTRFIIDNNLENNVVMLGYVENPYPYINKASYVVLLSEAEGFPTVLVEALALGKGFISTPVGGTNELYNNQKCGFVSDDNEEISNYLIEELSKKKEDRFIKSEVCKKYVDKYSLDKQIASIKKIINEL
ncbi:glycosyltransferase [Streptococcus chosunense]|uniref:Glycosyltransferase n=1 Tax=Streptococcus chosunensis TaxID=2707003 RepID=A0A3B0BLU1_9STRE|nr:glycosyltransferase [Streptococcus chosunense]RKN73301.1 glycosyltransferase [Streptococcus chosunense]